MTLKEVQQELDALKLKMATANTPIVLQRDRKLRRYDGTNETCEEWIDEARDCIKVQQLTAKHAAHYVTSSLSGDIFFLFIFLFIYFLFFFFFIKKESGDISSLLDFFH